MDGSFFTMTFMSATQAQSKAKYMQHNDLKELMFANLSYHISY